MIVNAVSVLGMHRFISDSGTEMNTPLQRLFVNRYRSPLSLLSPGHLTANADRTVQAGFFAAAVRPVTAVPV